MTLHVAEHWAEYTGFALTDNQIGTVESILGRVEDRATSVLEGPAGTGKSTLMSALILECVMQGLTVCLTAPTHKAAKVLHRMLQRLEEATSLQMPEPKTIHSVLNLKITRGQPGQPDKLYQSHPPDLGGYDLCIVDECSMIGQELFRYITNAVMGGGPALLFTGDSCQLQPVNEYRKSPTFTAGTRHVLTEVLRHDGPILTLATRARKIREPQVLQHITESSSVITYSSTRQMETAWLDRVAATDAAGQDPPTMLCWTNANRRRFNQIARRRLHGNDVPDFMAGDQLVTLNAYMANGITLINNNMDIAVKSAEYVRGYKPLPGKDYTYNVWELLLADLLPVHVLCDDDAAQYRKDLAGLGAEIKKELKAAEALVSALAAKDSDFRNKELAAARTKRNQIHSRWKEEFFKLKEAFIDVDFNYSCTIHKSQGSTFDEVFIWDDYVKSGERKELLYVAVTRAAKAVHHMHVGPVTPAQPKTAKKALVTA